VRNAASGIRQFASFFLRAYPLRIVLMVAVITAAGFAESIGVMALVPVLEVAGGTAAVSTPVGDLLTRLLGRFGLQPALAPLLLAVVVLITVKAALLSYAGRTAGYMMADVSRDLRLRLMQALLSARWSYFGEKPIGRFANAIGQEVNRTAAAFRESCQFIASSVQILAYLVVATILAWQVTAAAVVLGVGLTILFTRFFRSSRAAGVAQTKHNKVLTGRLVDVLQGLKPLKAMAREHLVWPLLERETQRVSRAQRQQVRAAEGRNLLYEPIVTALLAAGLFGVVRFGGQPMTHVLVLAVVFYRVMQHLNSLHVRYQLVLTGQGAFLALMAELREAEAAREDRRPELLPMRLEHRLELREVSFGYDDRDLLRGLSLEVPAGAFVAITGPSGSGKTTLADLIVGLRRPDRGRILIDDVPLDELDTAAWRHTIGYVPQEMLVLNDTILRNVTLGDEMLTREDAERALRLAGAWEFVQEKPGGLDRGIGDRGSTLSGGQRQRIAIARALVWEPSLLILDEVTTALDPVTEREICATLRSLKGGTTIIAISHQPLVREAADVAYVLEHGQLRALAPGFPGRAS
jgi:ATP-binding cassette, subfamily C, bacterial